MEKKLNNMLSFSDFEKSWKPEESKKTKRTDVGLDVVKESISEDEKKEMKSWYKKADNIVSKVQNKVTKKGGYENAGQKEIRQFEDSLDNTKLSHQAKSVLKSYINDKVDNIKY